MKSILVVMHVFISCSLMAQDSDSLVIKEVDSLIMLAHKLANQSAFDKALQVNSNAEKIILERLGSESVSYSRCCMNYGNIFYFASDFPKAEKWYLEAKAIREKVLGKDHVQYGQTISNLGVIYDLLGIFDKAESMQLEAIRIMEINVGKDHPHYAQGLHHLGSLYFHMGYYEKAEPLLKDAIIIRKKSLGGAHEAYVSSLIVLANNYYSQWKYEKAELLLLEAKVICENNSPTNILNYLGALGGLGQLYRQMGKYQEAESSFLNAIKIIENVNGKINIDYCVALINLATIYILRSDFEYAEKLLTEAREILETRLNSPTRKYYETYADCLFSRGNLYRAAGNYVKAESFYLNVLEIFEKTLGKDHDKYIDVLTNLAILYHNMGNYNQAELLLLELLSIKQEKLGKDHLDYAYSLVRLANLYSELDIKEKVEPLYLEALSIFEKTLIKDHSDYAGVISNLAIYYKSMGQFEKAEQMLLQALSMEEASLGKGQTDYANSLLNLANLYSETQKFVEAEPLYQEVKAIRAKALGKDHPDYAQALNNLGNFNRRISKPEIAELMYLEAKAIREVAFGKRSPTYSKNMVDLATVNAVLGKMKNAEELFNEMTELDRMHITNALSHLSEKELGSYLKYYSDRQEHVWAFSHFFIGQTSTDITFDNALFHKGFLLNASKGLSHLALSDSVSAEKFLLLKSYGRRLAVQYSKPIADRDSAQIANLEEKANNIEKVLARSSKGFNEAMRQVHWKDVSQRLKQGEAAIEFVHYKYYDFQRDLLTDSTIYTAIIVLPDVEKPLFLPLCEERELALLIQAKLNNKANTINNLYAWADRDTTKKMGIGGTLVKLGVQKLSLYELIWEKIEAYGLKGVKTIYYAPSGILHRINMGAIAVDDNQRLSDRYQLVAVNSTRQIVTGKPDEPFASGGGAIVYGGIHFEADTTKIIPFEESDIPLLVTRSLLTAVVDSTLRGGTWQYLHWTQKEAEVISTTLSNGGLKSEHRFGKEATEEGFKAMGQSNNPSPRV